MSPRLGGPNSAGLSVMDSRLSAIASRQGGVFTSAQAQSCGYSREAVRHRVRAGQWCRFGRGIFGVAPSDSGDAAALARAAWTALVAHRDAVVGFGAAAQLHGLATFRPVPGIQLVRSATAGRTPGRRGTPILVAALPGDQTSEPAGVPATSMARTAADIARCGSLRDGVVVLDSALQLRCLRSEIDAVVASCSGWPGARALQRAWSIADEGAESPLESLAHVLQAEAGVPRPLTQVSMFDGQGFIGRVDDFWPEHATVGESDGMLKYDDPTALRAEKLRQERLEQAGLQVVRVSYSDVTRRLAATARRYHEAFERGRLRLAWRPLDLETSASPPQVGLKAR